MDNNLISYKTVKKECSAEFTEKKSVFICTVKPVWNEQSALDFINQIRKKHGDASHNVYAYIIRDANIIRFSDDGEPNSTAGIPALSVLQKNDLTNIAAVVTRYFGGILLGAGGLVRAYSRAAKLAVDESGIVLYENHIEFDVLCGYPDYDKILKFIKSEKIITDNTVFGENIILSLAVKYNLYEKICADIINLTNGKSDIIKNGERFSSSDLF
ncbi:MAG: YigZ family protein [Oscillospiraceae bacterium]|nr:YigZ family protein [Oscillospiraceae bacterium]